MIQQTEEFELNFILLWRKEALTDCCPQVTVDAVN